MFYIVYFVFFLAACKGQDQTNHQDATKRAFAIGPSENFSTIEKLIRLKRYNEKSLVHEKDSSVEIFRSDHMFFSVVEGQEGNIWIGTIKGVFRYDGRGISYFKKK